MRTYIAGMRNAVLSFSLALAMLAAGCTGAHVLPPMNAAADVDDLTAKVVALGDVEDGEIDIYCSGVWVAPRVIATAEHCVRDLKPGTQVSYVVKTDMVKPGQYSVNSSIETRMAVLDLRDVDHDVALLRAVGNVPSHEVAVIQPEIPLQGTQVHTLGAPLGVPWSYSRGDVAAIRFLPSRTEQEILTIQVTAPISGGNSGGGLFNDRGELIGICRATYTNGQNMNLFTHISYVSAILEK